MPDKERCPKCNGTGRDVEQNYVMNTEFLDGVAVTEHLIRVNPSEEKRTKCEVCDGRGWVLCK